MLITGIRQGAENCKDGDSPPLRLSHHSPQPCKAKGASLTAITHEDYILTMAATLSLDMRSL